MGLGGGGAQPRPGAGIQAPRRIPLRSPSLPPSPSSAPPQRGAYAYRAFSFSPSGLLTSAAGTSAAGALPPRLASYDPEVVIDRLVVLGLVNGPQGWTASLTAGGETRQLQAAPGPLYQREGLPDMALVVRKAALPLTADWSIQFSRAAGAGGATS